MVMMGDVDMKVNSEYGQNGEKAKISYSSKPIQSLVLSQQISRRKL